MMIRQLSRFRVHSAAMRKLLVCALLVACAPRSSAAAVISPGDVLSIDFDLLATPWAGQAGVYDPNLIFLEFRGGVTLSPGTVTAATLYIDGVALGSTGADANCTLCSSVTWQFAATGVSGISQFPSPTLIDFAPVLVGSQGSITLTVLSGLLTFGAPPYENNAPVVVFDNVASCGNNCTAIRPVNLDGVNQTYEVTPVPEPATLALVGACLPALLYRARRRIADPTEHVERFC